MTRCGGLQKLSRPRLRCHATSHCTPANARMRTTRRIQRGSEMETSVIRRGSEAAAAALIAIVSPCPCPVKTVANRHRLCDAPLYGYPSEGLSVNFTKESLDRALHLALDSPRSGIWKGGS